jgi:hypothetical protein
VPPPSVSGGAGCHAGAVPGSCMSLNPTKHTQQTPSPACHRSALAGRPPPLPHPLFSASSAPSATSAYQSPLFEPFAPFAFTPTSHDLCAQNGRGARNLTDFLKLFLPHPPQHLTPKQATAYRPGLCAQIGPPPGITEQLFFQTAAETNPCASPHQETSSPPPHHPPPPSSPGHPREMPS